MVAKPSSNPRVGAASHRTKSGSFRLIPERQRPDEPSQYLTAGARSAWSSAFPHATGRAPREQHALVLFTAVARAVPRGTGGEHFAFDCDSTVSSVSAIGSASVFGHTRGSRRRVAHMYIGGYDFFWCCGMDNVQPASGAFRVWVFGREPSIRRCSALPYPSARICPMTSGWDRRERCLQALALLFVLALASRVLWNTLGLLLGF